MEWENVIFNEPTMSVSGNYIYFNAVFRDIIGDEKGMDFFFADDNGKKILSCKPGSQFRFSKKKNECRIICKELADYILSVYDCKPGHFKLVLHGEYYILVPDKI